MSDNPYTPKQRGSLHVWCELMAETLDAHGLDMKKTLKPSVDIPWNKDRVKEFIYKPVMEALTGKDSTEDQNTVEPTEVIEVITRHFSEKHGVQVPPWPDRFGSDQ